MTKFNYEAKKGPKEIVTGTIEADDQEAAVDKLNQMGYMPITVIPAVGNPLKKDSHAQNTSKEPGQSAPPGKVREKDLTIFIEQLASLIKSKVPILEAIEAVSYTHLTLPTKRIV